MMTTVRVWKDSGVSIVAPAANLHAYDAGTLRDALREAQKLTDVSVVIVTFEAAVLVDVDALDVMMTENRAYAEHGGRIVLTGVSVPIRRLLDLSGVVNLMATYPSLQDALREVGHR